ncbi:WD repeat-containing protein 63, partial [Cricetulus griseus]
TGPLLQTCCAPKRYTAGHWSLTRPGVFYIGREDGYVDIWDLLEKTHEPAQSQNICITMITYIKPWTFSSKQQFIAIADYYGTLHILEIPWTLSRPSFNEVSSVNYYFEREVKHLDYVQQRKLIREEEKREIALELAKKKAVSEISGRRAVFCSSQWERVAGLIPLSPVRSALGSLLCLRR